MTATRPPPPLRLRPGTAADLQAVTALYGHHVQHGTGTFETIPPSLAEMARRHQAVLDQGLPWLVAEVADSPDAAPDGRAQPALLGFAYAQAFRARQAFGWCLEDSVYVLADARRRGVGRLLLTELIGRCEALGARQMLAAIGDSANAGSIALHAALGFQPVGTLRAAGWKFGRWCDVALMQRSLGWGDTTPPHSAGVLASATAPAATETAAAAPGAGSR